MPSETDGRLANVENEVKLLKELQLTLLEIRQYVLEVTLALRGPVTTGPKRGR